MLQALSCGIRETITVLESSSSTSLDGIYISHSKKTDLITLPDEILCAIAQEIQGHPEVDDLGKQHLRIQPFSHTCRKLRGAVLSFPGLWTTISSDFKKSQVKTYLKRSRNLPLNGIVHLRKLSTDDEDSRAKMVKSLKRFVNRATPERWRVFIIRVARCKLDSYVPTLLDFLRTYKSLPELHALAIHLDEPDIGGYNSIDEFDNRFHFYESWIMPNLRQFTFENFIPRGGSTQAATSMTGLFRPRNLVDHSIFADFLQQNPHIRKLKLVDANFYGYSGSPAVLEKVESLDVSWRAAYGDGKLMSQLRLPNVVTIKVSLCGVDKSYDAEIRLDELLDGEEIFEKVSSFDMSIKGLGFEHEEYDASRIFRAFPNLEELSVEVLRRDGGRVEVLHRVGGREANSGFWDIGSDTIPPELRLARFRFGNKYGYEEKTIFSLLDKTKVQNVELHLACPLLGNLSRTHVGNTKHTWDVLAN